MPFDFNIPADNSPLNSAEIREQFRAIVQDKIVDADKVDGKHASELASVDLSNVSDAVILTKIKNVDGSGSGLDADKVDGKHASELASVDLSNVSDAVILTKIKNVDGSGSGLDADTLDGRHASAFASNNHTHIVWNFTLNNSYGLPLGSPITINVNSQWRVPSNAKAIIGSLYLEATATNSGAVVSFCFYFYDNNNYSYLVIRDSFNSNYSVRFFVIIPIRSDGTIKIRASVSGASNASARFYYYGYLT